MQHFTGTEYVKIDIANQFGLDRLEWSDRIHWVNDNRNDLRALTNNAEHPILMSKAVRALETIDAGETINHMVGLDATASGIQIMAAMSGCVSSGQTVNLVNTGRREDLYQWVADQMAESCGKKVDRKVIKKPTMTYFYGSHAQPRDALGGQNSPLYKAFNSTMQTSLRGPAQLMELFLGFWNPKAAEYSWAMPDGHVVRVPVIETVEKGMEIDEAGHLRYTHRTAVQRPIAKGRALAANIVHSVDAWICREMVRRADEAGYMLAPTHDCFSAHPNNLNNVRENYRNLLCEVAEMNTVSMILSQIADRHIGYTKLSNRLPGLIKDAEYCLS
jgi:DNA-directed RNA polymerase